MNYKNLLFFNKTGHQSNFVWNGEFWETRIMLPQVSVDLFEIEHLFIVEKFEDLNGNTAYGYPHITPNLSSTSASGIYGSFKSGSKKVIVNNQPVLDFIGSKIFCQQFPNGNLVTAVNIEDKTIELENAAIYSEDLSPLFFNLWRVSFETTRNVLDFDAFDPFKANITKGLDYITAASDISSILDNDEFLMILGDGIPKDARITKVSGNKIYLNKKCEVTLTDSTVFVYPVEERNEVSSYIYQYILTEDSTLDAPVLKSISTNYLKIDYDPNETVNDYLRTSGEIYSGSISVNIALNSTEEGVFGRTLVIEDLSLGYPKTVARIEIHGETVGEDERYKTILNNFGRRLNAEDAYILRDSDPKEPFTDYEILNDKRKELLLEGHEIYSYLGSYKGLVNAIKFFGYQDLRIKEYWLNIKKSESETSALKQNTDFLEKWNSTPNGQQNLIASIIDDENSEKYKQIEIYGKRSDGTFGLKSSMEKLFPSSSFKKTALFGLFYDINRIVENEEDVYEYPVVENAFVFSPEEVLIKLFGLKEKLKKDYLPLNARIIDITGEGVYFGIYKTRAWTDNLKIDELDQGIDLELGFTPEYGYIEDLRPFSIRPNTDIPYVPYVGTEPNTYNLSTYGNLVDIPQDNLKLPGKQSKRLADAIKLFYDERNTKGIKPYRLGDGDSKNGGYRKLYDGKIYNVPAGFPVTMEITSFNLSWDEVNNQWDSLDRNISTYSTSLASTTDVTGYNDQTLIDSNLSFEFNLSTIFGTLFNINLQTGISILNPTSGKVQLKFTSNLDSDCQFLCEVQSYSTLTGVANVKLLWTKNEGIFDEWKVEIVNIFKDRLDLSYYDYSFNPDGFYSWDNLRFAGFYEVEWKITKKDDRPYYYELRGKITDYYKLPVMLPYDGIYSVQCRVWDGFNDICSTHYENCLEVKKREVELFSVSRFREAEVYTWDQTNQPWDNFESMWIFPVEKRPEEPRPSNLVLNPAEYGNQFNEGQRCKILKSFPETLGSALVRFGLQKIPMSSFTSSYSGTGSGPAIATLNSSYLPHSFTNGERVTIIDEYNTGAGNISGTYLISNVTSTGFTLPIILANPVTPSLISVVKSGNITVKYQGSDYHTVSFNGRLDTTLGNLMSKFNGFTKDPAFGIDTITTSAIFTTNVQEWRDVVFKSPIGSGGLYNGKSLEFITTGGLYLYDGSSAVKSYSTQFSGGVNSYSDYVDYNFDGDLPTENTRYYGTKTLNWDSFDALSWNNLYSQTWGMYDFHNDWLGGFSLYNLQSGDKVRVSQNSRGIILGNVSSPDASPNYLDLREAADQLNASTDPNISRFYYEVRGFSKLPEYFKNTGDVISPGLTCISRPYKEETSSYDLQVGSPAMGAPLSIKQDRNGDIIMGGVISVKVMKSPTDIDYYYIGTEYPGSVPRKVLPDEYGNWWCYGERCSIPLVVYHRQNPEGTILVSSVAISGFSRPDLNYLAPVPDSQFQIICLDVDNLTENFVMYVKYRQGYTVGVYEDVYRLIEFNASSKEFNILSTLGPAWTSMKTYDIGSIVSKNGLSYKSLQGSNVSQNPETTLGYWELIPQESIGIIDTTLYSIRQLKYEYIGKKSKLWMVTNNGLKTYNGIKIDSLDTTNSGLHANDLYSLEIDEVGGKWIGSSSGICYYDNIRWGCWTPTTNPELPLGKSRNIVSLGSGRIFFIVQTGTEIYELVYFNGISFVVYTDDPGTVDTFGPSYNLDYDYEDIYFFRNNVKYIDGNFTRNVGDLFYLGDEPRIGTPYVNVNYWDQPSVGSYPNPQNIYVRKISFVIPYIHASAKTPGISGWDFIYHLSYRPVPDPIYVREKGIGETEINFNFIVGPLYTASINIGKEPQLPYVDSKSWKIPSWINYDFKDVTNSHPGIDIDDLFLDAPLRDISSGAALKESYWRNSNVIRSSARDIGNLLDRFEWVIKIGDTQDDRGIRTHVDEDGYIYVTGFFSGTISFGSKNNLPIVANTTLISNSCKSIFVAKYNQFGVVQWARKYGDGSFSGFADYDFTPTGIKVDRMGNVIVVGYREKNRNNTTSELPTNIYLKWNWNAVFVSGTNLFSPSSDTARDLIKDLAIDLVGNVYVAGTFSGTLSSGSFSITSAGLDPEVFIARIEGDGNVKWLYKANSGGTEENPSIVIGKDYEDLYLSYSSRIGSAQNLILSKFISYDFNLGWTRSYKNVGHSSYHVFPRIKVSGNGEIALGATFSGFLEVDGKVISSNGNKDIAIMKFNGHRNLWAKSVGSIYADYCQDVEIDSDGNIYILGSYDGPLIVSPEFSSPIYYPSPEGDSDIILFKYDHHGTLLDIVDAGGINRDEGISLSLDKEDNIYLTGYVSGESQFSNWITSPSGGEDAFIGKITNLKYRTGKKIGGVYSWFGSGSWTAGDRKISNKEFEVPIGTTVIFNPIDSLIPGQKNIVYTLINDDDNENLIEVKDTHAFIWTFNQPGFYTLHAKIEDSNGNVYIHNKKGYIRVIDHKNPPPGEIVDLVNSDIFRKRAIYEKVTRPQII